MAWSKARVTDINEEMLKVHFMGDSADELLNLSRHSLDIAPEGTRCHDFDGRYKWKVGDEVDCCDEIKIWYKATILKIEIVPSTDENPHPTE